MPTARLAVWWVIVSEIVIFGGLLAAFILHRVGHGSWGSSAGHTKMIFGAINTFVLLTSSLCAVLAHHAAMEKNGKKAAKLLGLTILGGLIFLCVKSVEWHGEITAGYTLTTDGFWSFYYTAAGLHAFHVIAGMVLMGWVAMSAWKNEELHRVEVIGIYWHFVDLVWIFLFPLLYIASGL